MPDRHVVTSSQSWFSRLGGAIKGVIFGILLIVGGIMLLFWGEGRAVKRAKALAEGSGKVVAVGADRVDPGHQGDLVHLSGEAVTDETLEDPLFGIRQEGALRLERQVEMYQWVERSETEERKKLGGGTETTTTYRYEQQWSSSPVRSSGFEVPAGHENPEFPFSSESWRAERVTVGAFLLGEALKAQVSKSQPLAVTADDLYRVPGELGYDLQASGDRFYRAYDPDSPEVGDVRVSFAVVRPTTVSVVARQQGDELISYPTEVGGSIALLSYGNKSPEEMFEAAKAANAGLLWILRVVGFFVVFVGFAAVLKPLSVFADVIPFLGNLVGAGTGFVAFLLAAVISLVTVAVGWIFYRPVLGIALLALAVALGVGLLLRGRKAAPAVVPAAAPGVAPPPPPPPP